jgi:hypothetical protein
MEKPGSKEEDSKEDIEPDCDGREAGIVEVGISGTNRKEMGSTKDTEEASDKGRKDDPHQKPHPKKSSSDG